VPEVMIIINFYCVKSIPFIELGFGSLKMPRMVGAISAKVPFFIFKSLLVRMAGTGFRV
jgi:hypothetical protein